MIKMEGDLVEYDEAYIALVGELREARRLMLLAAQEEPVVEEELVVEPEPDPIIPSFPRDSGGADPS